MIDDYMAIRRALQWLLGMVSPSACAANAAGAGLWLGFAPNARLAIERARKGRASFGTADFIAAVRELSGHAITAEMARHVLGHRAVSVGSEVWK